MNITPEDVDTFTARASASVIKNDRELYDPYFAAFEEYVIGNNLTFTLLSAARFIIANQDSRPSHDSYFLTISSPSPEKHAREVANIILDIKSIASLPKRVILKKDSVGWTVTINGRGCFVIAPEMKYRGKSVDEIIGRERGRGLWTGKEVMCQNVYGVCAYLLSQLYDPMRFVPKEVSRSLLVDLLMIAGGDVKEGGRQKKKRDDRRDDKHGKKRTAIADIIARSSANIYMVGMKKGSLPIYLYDGDFDDFRNILTSSTSCRVAAYSLHDYDDFALTKYTIHDGDDRAVCIFYNSLEHQMIPVTAPSSSDGFGDVSKVYTLRSIILEIQMLKLMSQLGKDMTGMINNLRRDVADMRNMISVDAEEVVGYVGRYVNWNVLRRESGGFFGVFYPTDDGRFGMQHTKKGGYFPIDYEDL